MPDITGHPVSYKQQCHLGRTSAGVVHSNITESRRQHSHYQAAPAATTPHHMPGWRLCPGKLIVTCCCAVGCFAVGCCALLQDSTHPSYRSSGGLPGPNTPLRCNTRHQHMHIAYSHLAQHLGVGACYTSSQPANVDRAIAHSHSTNMHNACPHIYSTAALTAYQPGSGSLHRAQYKHNGPNGIRLEE